MTKEEQLLDACSTGDLELVKTLVEEVDPRLQDDKPFCTACVNGNLEIAKFLLEKGADIHAQEDYAIKWSQEFHQDDVVEFLKENM
jgi:ankyrin repeat protein